jgi:hypothetical protein
MESLTVQLEPNTDGARMRIDAGNGRTYAAGWDRCYALYCAIGYCIHTIVNIGDIAPGGKATRTG